MAERRAIRDRKRRTQTGAPAGSQATPTTDRSPPADSRIDTVTSEKNDGACDPGQSSKDDRSDSGRSAIQDTSGQTKRHVPIEIRQPKTVAIVVEIPARTAIVKDEPASNASLSGGRSPESAISDNNRFGVFSSDGSDDNVCLTAESKHNLPQTSRSDSSAKPLRRRRSHAIQSDPLVRRGSDLPEKTAERDLDDRPPENGCPSSVQHPSTHSVASGGSDGEDVDSLPSTLLDDSEEGGRVNASTHGSPPLVSSTRSSDSPSAAATDLASSLEPRTEEEGEATVSDSPVSASRVAVLSSDSPAADKSSDGSDSPLIVQASRPSKSSSGPRGATASALQGADHKDRGNQDGPSPHLSGSRRRRQQRAGTAGDGLLSQRAHSAGDSLSPPSVDNSKGSVLQRADSHLDRSPLAQSASAATPHLGVASSAVAVDSTAASAPPSEIKPLVAPTWSLFSSAPMFSFAKEIPCPTNHGAYPRYEADNSAALIRRLLLEVEALRSQCDQLRSERDHLALRLTHLQLLLYPANRTPVALTVPAAATLASVPAAGSCLQDPAANSAVTAAVGPPTAGPGLHGSGSISGSGAAWGSRSTLHSGGPVASARSCDGGICDAISQADESDQTGNGFVGGISVEEYRRWVCDDAPSKVPALSRAHSLASPFFEPSRLSRLTAITSAVAPALPTTTTWTPPTIIPAKAHAPLLWFPPVLSASTANRPPIHS
jgi:hypothetical protein